jgi:hypothetical protein
MAAKEISVRPDEAGFRRIEIIGQQPAAHDQHALGRLTVLSRRSGPNRRYAERRLIREINTQRRPMSWGGLQ